MTTFQQSAPISLPLAAQLRPKQQPASHCRRIALLSTSLHHYQPATLSQERARRRRHQPCRILLSSNKTDPSFNFHNNHNNQPHRCPSLHNHTSSSNRWGNRRGRSSCLLSTCRLHLDLFISSPHNSHLYGRLRSSYPRNHNNRRKSTSNLDQTIPSPMDSLQRPLLQDHRLILACRRLQRVKKPALA